MNQTDFEPAIRRAGELYRQGQCNCAQSVVMAFAEYLHLDSDTASRMCAALGGGIGGMRGPCGAVLGMSMLAGCLVSSNDAAGRREAVRLTREMSARFEQECGSLICGELIGVKQDTPLFRAAGARPVDSRMPCDQKIETAARILAECINN